MTMHGLYSRLPGYDPAATRKLFQEVTNVRTLVVYCPDPRAAGIPAAVAKEFGEIYPGEILRDELGNKIAFTTDVGQLIVAGGRAVDVLRSVTVLNHLLGASRVVVVHHTFCGMTAFAPGGVADIFLHEHRRDVSGIYDPKSMYIDDFEASLRHDVALLRAAPGIPGSIALFGYVFDIDTETLTKIVEDIPASV